MVAAAHPSGTGYVKRSPHECFSTGNVFYPEWGKVGKTAIPKGALGNSYRSKLFAIRSPKNAQMSRYFRLIWSPLGAVSVPEVQVVRNS